ncbi:MAG: hypothetical protein FWG98_15395, partial [Candidatus Cloacimonetes bacterium]|nr:hypothetical protein [Candidatus Cloacimonadota bacterium]
VSVDGIISAVSEGETIITVISEEGGFTATCEVIVFYEPEIIVFTVENTEQWNESVEFIRGNGDNKIYEVNVIDDFSLKNRYAGEPTFGLSKNIAVSIIGNHQLFLCRSIYVGTQQIVTIHDITLNGENRNIGWMVYVDGNNANFIMSGKASIINSINGGINIREYGSFILKDGTISGNTLYGASGAGVSVSGTFIMLDGHITSNNAQQVEQWHGNGGGVSVVGENATFIMYGGAIANNIASNYGGGVYLGIDASFYFFNGDISRNKTYLGGYGGGMYVYFGSLSMYGGSISGNFSPRGGGLVLDNGDFTIIDGIIYGNIESGVPEYLANISNFPHRASMSRLGLEISKYGDGTDILPHTDENNQGTDYTIKGK